MQRKGFTLMEVLVAVAIVATLSTAAITNYGAGAARVRWDAARAALIQVYQGQRAWCSAVPAPAGFVGPIAATCVGAACGWRSLGMENPNDGMAGFPSQQIIQLSIDNVSGDCQTGTFRIVAARGGGAGGPTQALDQDFVFGTAGTAWPQP